MPEMDGYQVCRQLKTEGATQDIPVIFITANDQSEGLVDGFKAGAVDYITKPFRDEEVLMRVETQIEAAVAELAASTPENARVLDAGSGEGRYASSFDGRRHIGVDLGIGDHSWDYSRVDVAANLETLPFPDNSFDAALNIVVLEHTRNPQQVLNELGRTLRPGGRLLLIAPQLFEVLRTVPPGPEQQQIAEQVAKETVQPRLGYAFLAAVVTVALGMYKGVLPGTR